MSPEALDARQKLHSQILELANGRKANRGPWLDVIDAQVALIVSIALKEHDQRVLAELTQAPGDENNA